MWAVDRATVILDKSYLQGSKADQIQALCRAKHVLMPDVLFYELMSSEEPDRSRCFGKLPPNENPVTLVPNVGALLRYEFQTHQPSGPPSQHALDLEYSFNPGLATQQFRLPEIAQAAIDEENALVRVDLSIFAEKVRVAGLMFPDVLRGSDLQRKIARFEAERVISADSTAVLSFYAQLSSPDVATPFPPADLVSPDWATFRWLQASLLITLDLCCRYSGTLPTKMSDKLHRAIEHDMLDSHYAVLGALEGRLATRDKKLARLWSLMRPDGDLIS